MSRTATLIALVVLASGCADSAPPVGSGASGPLAPIRQVGYLLEGFGDTERLGVAQRAEEEASRYVVPKELPEVSIRELAAVMIGDDGQPLVPPALRLLDGQRVRLKGYALPLGELADADAFVLQEEPFIRCVHFLRPSTNRQVLVRLAAGTSFDFTDAPVWVEGVLRSGRYDTFADGDVAVWALDGGRFEVLPPERMDLPIHVPHDHGHEVHLRPAPGDGVVPNW